MPFNIADGTYSEAASVLPLQDTGPGISPLAGISAVAGQQTPADQGGVRDLTGERLEQLAGYEQDIAAAQHAGMSARESMVAHYEATALPLGGQVGDNMIMPVVPDNAVVPASSDAYPWPGDEPVPSSAGPSYQGNVPT